MSRPTSPSEHTLAFVLAEASHGHKLLDRAANSADARTARECVLQAREVIHSMDDVLAEGKIYRDQAAVVRSVRNNLQERLEQFLIAVSDDQEG